MRRMIPEPGFTASGWAGCAGASCGRSMIAITSSSETDDVVPVSVNSPMGESLFKARVGDTIRVKAPRGTMDFKILALTFLSVVRRQGVISGQNVDDVDDLGLARNV